MFPTQFAYHRPGTVKEAVELLASDPDAKVLAGGHSLLPAMKLRLASPSALVDISRIKELHGIKINGGITIGALTTYRELLDSAPLQKLQPVIAETANNVGDPMVRNRGTLGGSLAHADPAADFTAVMLALGASVKATGKTGARTIGLDDLFVDLLTTSLKPDELLTEIDVPALASRTAVVYEKHPHPASGYAVVGVAALVTLGGDGRVSAARIAVTGATAKATRAKAAEQALTGQALDGAAITAAASASTSGLDINGDFYASADYRKHLVEVSTRRALERIASQLGKQ